MKRILYSVLVALLCFIIPLSHAQDILIDLKPYVNTSFEDDGVANNGKGGWTDEGINDMYIYPPLEYGQITRNGYTFNILSPGDAKGNSFIMLKGEERGKDKPEQVQIKLNEQSTKFIYILQNSTGGSSDKSKNYEVAVYTLNYADGSQHEFSIKLGEQIRHWWTGQWYDNSGAEGWPFFMGRNFYSMKWKKYIGVWATQLENPHPNKKLQSITLKSNGKATPMIFAISLSNDNHYKDPNLKVDYKRPEGTPPGYFDKKMKQESAALLRELSKTSWLKGIRKVEVIRSDIIALTVDSAFGDVGIGPGTQELKALQNPKHFLVNGQAPQSVYRHTYEYWNGDIGDFKQNVIYWTTLYLQLKTPLKENEICKTEITKGLDASYQNTISFTYDPKKLKTSVIKINQGSYSSSSKRRYAYLGMWIGDGGAVDYQAYKSFKVIDKKSNKEVLTGSIVQRKMEDSISGEDVYEMDISNLQSGTYYIQIPGLACSGDFHVNGQAMKDLYLDTMRAFYHQRCGLELEAAYTDFPRPAADLECYESGHMVGSSHYTPKPNEKTKTFTGGYHDAGDNDVFTYHLRATAQTLRIYEAFPEKFKEDLNLPESSNGIPDILDEAHWALFFYHDNQQADGGIPLGRGNDEDFIREWEKKFKSRPAYGIFPPRQSSCTEYAATAAIFARCIQRFKPQLAKDYLESAKRAYAWAVKHKDQFDPWERSAERVNWLKGWAAAELFKSTGDPKYQDDFKILYAQKHHWSSGQYRPIMWDAFVTSEQANTDKELQAKVQASLIKSADYIVKMTESSAYRMGRGTKATGGWGNLNGGGYYADPLIRAWLITKDQKYLDCIGFNADFQLGTNPLSKTFLSGIGIRPPNFPQLNPKLYSGPNKTGKTVSGICIYGLATRDLKNWYPNPPAWRRWRDLGNGGAEVSSEFTVTETIGATAMLYSFLYAIQ